MFKIELDSYYTVRAGHKAKCVHKTAAGHWLFIYIDGPFRESCFIVSEAGSYNFGLGPSTSPYDIVAPWQEPRCIYVGYENGEPVRASRFKSSSTPTKFMETTDAKA